DPFPVSISGSTNFTTLTYINGAPNGVIQSVNIQVAAGDTIGILGTAGTANSYTSSAVHTSTIAGFTVNINRLGTREILIPARLRITGEWLTVLPEVFPGWKCII